MLWTLVGLIAILGSLILHFLQKVVTALNKYAVHPSEAEVDQVLPEEIFEHVMTFLDPLGLIECHSVSKYWRYNAMKPMVEKCVMDIYEREMKAVTIDKEKLSLKVAKKFNKDNIWLDDPKYPRNLLLRDRAIACKHGKQLLEIEPEGLPAIVETFRSDAHKYMIKLRGHKTSMREESVYFFAARGYHEIFFKKESVPGLNWDSIAGYRAVDIVFDLEDFLNDEKKRLKDQKVYSISERHPVQYFGFVPLNKDLFPVLALTFAPSIVHDVLHSAFLSVVKIWFGPLIFLATCAANLILAKDFSGGRVTAQPLFFFTFAAFSTAYLLLPILTWPYSTNYFAALGICALTLLYLIFAWEHTFPWHYKPTLRRVLPAMIGLTEILLLNDWKVVVHSIKTGVIWWRLFDNTVLYAWFCVHMIALNFMSKVARQHNVQWQYLVEWQKHHTTCSGLLWLSAVYDILWTDLARKSCVALLLSADFICSCK